MPFLSTLAAGAAKAFGLTVSSGVNVARDLYFKFVTLLIKGDMASNIDQVTTIGPAYNIDQTVTQLPQFAPNGNSRPNNFSPYLGSYYGTTFNGSTDYYNVAAGSLIGTGPFTIEAWINPTSLPTTGTIVSNMYWDCGNAGGYYLTLGSSGAITLTAATTAYNTWPTSYTTTLTVKANRWSHVAVSRDSSNIIRIFIDGNVGYTSTANNQSFSLVTTPTNGPCYGHTANGLTFQGTRIGARGPIDTTAYQDYFPGRIHNVYINNTTCLYEASFVPSTSPYDSTKLPGGSVLLAAANYAHFETTTNKTVTIGGTPLVTALVPGTRPSSMSTYGSGVFDGSSYLMTPGKTALAFDTGDFTVEWWWYLNTAFTGIQGPGIGQKASDTTNGWVIYRNNSVNTDKISIRISSANSDYATTVVPAVGIWQHWAVTRSGTTLQWYCNGVACGTYTGVTGNATDITGNMYVGYSQTWAYTTGSSYISDVRVTKGTARYTGTTTFTPPASPLATTGSQLSLLAYNGSLNNQLFKDNGGGNNLITRAGNASQGTFTPYGGNWSTLFNGSTDFLTVPSIAALNFGTSDFTVECWVFMPSTIAGTNGKQIIDFRPDSTNGAYFALGSSITGVIGTYVNSAQQITHQTAILPNQWYHIAVTRASSVTRIYINGVSSTSVASDTISYTTSGTIKIGTNAFRSTATDTYWNGYISNVRVVNGTALYTGASITAPTQPLLANNVNTVLLTCNTGSFIDLAKNSYVVTTSGTPKVTRFGPFSPNTVTANTGYFGVKFDGGSYLTTPTSTVTNVGTQDFTVEFWYYMTQTATYGTIFNLGQYNTGIFIRIDTQTYDVYIVNTQVFATGTAPLNTWVHLALVRKAGSLYLWANGVQVGTTVANTTSISPSSTMIFGASAHATTTERFFGYISNFRFVIGNGLYTTAFTPSTTPLTAIPGTVLLTFQNDTMKDNSASNFTLNLTVGTPSVVPLSPFTGQPYAYNIGAAMSPATISGSIMCDGTGDYITIPTNTMFSTFPASSDFTAEAWFYLNNVTATQQLIMSHRNSATGANGYVPFLIWATTSTLTLYMSSNNSSWDVVNGTSAGTLIPNQWYHVALCRSNGTVRLFLNGVQKITVANTSAYTTTQPFQVGMSTSEAASALNGYVCDVRIVNGEALYACNFLPPVSPLQSIKNTTLLLNFNNPGTFDSTGMNSYETVSVNPIVDNQSAKYGRSGFVFSNIATANTLTFPHKPEHDLITEDFTIEFWINPYNFTVNAQGYILSKDAVSGTNYPQYAIRMNSTGKILFQLGQSSGASTTQVVTSTGSLTVSQWNHVACVRSGTMLYIWINGISAVTPTAQSITMNASSRVLVINNQINGAVGDGVNAYIDDLRITKGFARYTTAFDPPGSFAENGPAS